MVAINWRLVNLVSGTTSFKKINMETAKDPILSKVLFIQIFIPSTGWPDKIDHAGVRGPRLSGTLVE